MRRRTGLCLLACALVATTLAVTRPGPAIATPTAFDDGTYSAFGRVFPDPHGCVRGAPGTSPWAKGNVCASQFLQWEQTLDGLRYLEQRFPRFLQVINLRTQFGELSALDGEELQSAGLPREDLSRDRRDLYVVKVTDRKSKVKEADRRHFAYSLSIHGIERAGVEGGIRAIEDLVTWAACESDPDAAPACAAEGPFPKRILEPSESGPTAGQVVRNGVVYFILSNPDGWHRGEWSEGGVFFQRYNGNGMDINRDWASVGYTEEQYTPFSEPETRGYAKFLKYVAGRTAAKRFAGAIDLHGMVTAPSFSFTLLGAGQRDYRKNAITVDTAITTFRDSEKRLSWSSLIAPAESCPGAIQEPAFGGSVPMCSDQWGTVWDTINYQVTGSFGDWMDSPLGLDGVGINNEMALSHLAPNNVFVPEIEQLHIDGNKGLVYSQIASLLFEKPVQFKPTGKIAFIADPARTSDPGGRPAKGVARGLPTQDDIVETSLNGIRDFEFEVKGPSDGVRNGGLSIEATFGHARGISAATASSLVLEYCGPGEHAGDPEGGEDGEGECREVAHYFNQSPLYLQAGARIDLNDPRPGPYRIVADPARSLPTSFHVTFHGGQAVPVPKQAAYDVSRNDFFEELNRYIPDGSDISGIWGPDVAARPTLLDRFDTVVIADRFAPGVPAAQRSAYTAALRGFVERGGNLVLTDGAMAGLPSVAGRGLKAGHVKKGVYYAGWMDFDDGKGETYARHRLAKGVNKEGTAEGVDTVGEQTFSHRHQTYEPVPLGFYVDQSGSANSQCTSARCDSPNWVVDQAAWAKAGGTTAARTLARTTTEPDPDAPTVVGTSLGELRVGRGVIRIAGALLPEPTEQNYHPFGLASYALTYTGYQLFENLVAYQRPR